MFVASFGGSFAILALVLFVENLMARRESMPRAHEARLKAILGLSFVSGIVIAIAGNLWIGLAIAVAALSASATSAAIDEYSRSRQHIATWHVRFETAREPR